MRKYSITVDYDLKGVKKMKFRRISKALSAILIVTIISVLFIVSAPADSRAEFPEKPVEMTLLFGGTANVIGHLMADLMGKYLGQPVVAVSRNGAGGAVGYTYVKSTPADAYNLVFNSNSISTAYHRGNIPFDYSVFDAVARVSIEVPVLAANVKSGWKNLNDLKEAALKSKYKLKIGISGKGAFTHLASAMLFDSMGISDKVIFIPYDKGKGPAELLARRVDVALQWPGQFKSYVKAGKLNILTVTSADRIKPFPSVATAKEQGFDVNISMWRGLAVPKGTPRDRVEKIQNAVKAAIESKEFIKVANEVGFEPAYLSATEFDSVIAEDDALIAQKIIALGLKR